MLRTRENLFTQKPQNGVLRFLGEPILRAKPHETETRNGNTKRKHETETRNGNTKPKHETETVKLP